MLPLLAWALAATTACPTEPPTEAGLRMAEQRWVAALEARDAAALACRLADGFSDQDWRGAVHPREAVLAALPQRTPSELRLDQVDARVIGTTGIVRGRNTQVARGGQVIGAVRFTDLFVYRDRRWQALAAQETVIAPQP